MNTVVGILDSLGVNYTFFWQLGLFMVVFIFVWNVAFVPYFRAYLERQARTTGSQESAQVIAKNTERLERDYQEQARKLNSEIKARFDEQRSAAVQEQESLLAAARDKAKAHVATSKEKIQSEYSRAREELASETKNLGQEIARRLTEQEMA